MKIIHPTIFIVLISSIIGCAKNTNFSSSKEKFNSDWYFTKVENEDVSDHTFINEEAFTAWQKISLPHTPQIEPKIVNNQWQVSVGTKKEFLLPHSKKGKKLFLHFEGAMNIGRSLGKQQKTYHTSWGYLPFVVDFLTLLIFIKKTLLL